MKHNLIKTVDKIDFTDIITALQSYGLTEEMLQQNWKPHPQYEGTFPPLVKLVLTYLITGQPQETLLSIEPLAPRQRLSPQLAIQEINELSLAALGALYVNYSYGLRRSHLINWQDLTNEQVVLMSQLFRAHSDKNSSVEEIISLTKTLDLANKSWFDPK